MNKSNNESGDRAWDECCGKYIQLRNYQKEWENDGVIRCPSCDEIKSKEDESHKLTYCDNCGYDF